MKEVEYISPEKVTKVSGKASSNVSSKNANAASARTCVSSSFGGLSAKKRKYVISPCCKMSVGHLPFGSVMFVMFVMLVKVMLGKVILGKVMLGKVILGKVMFGKGRFGMVMFGKVMLGKVMLGKVMLGKVVFPKVGATVFVGATVTFGSDCTALGAGVEDIAALGADVITSDMAILGAPVNAVGAIV